MGPFVGEREREGMWKREREIKLFSCTVSCSSPMRAERRLIINPHLQNTGRVGVLFTSKNTSAGPAPPHRGPAAAPDISPTCIRALAHVHGYCGTLSQLCIFLTIRAPLKPSVYCFFLPEVMEKCLLCGGPFPFLAFSASLISKTKGARFLL